MGNKASLFTTNGARNYAKTEREKHDYYATDPRAVDMLLERETFTREIWEPACGELHISNRLADHGYTVYNSDIIKRVNNQVVMDFLKYEPPTQNTIDIVTNPPYKYAKEFVQHALDISRGGVKVAMLLKLTFLETKGRYELFRNSPFKRLYVFSSRIGCAKNGDFKSHSQSAVAYGWYVWQKGWKGKPTIEWIKPE